MDSTGLGVLVGGSRYLRASTREPIFSFDMLDIEAGRLRTIELTFLAHGFSTMPGREHVAAVFEKRGPNAAVLDLLGSSMASGLDVDSQIAQTPYQPVDGSGGVALVEVVGTELAVCDAVANVSIDAATARMAFLPPRRVLRRWYCARGRCSSCGRQPTPP